MKNVSLAITAAVVLGIVWFYFSLENQTEEQSNKWTETTTLDLKSYETTVEHPFSINNVAVVGDVLQIDDGDPQTNDSTFEVTWNYFAEDEPGNAHISFTLVDENENVISTGLKGAGATKSYLNESAKLKLPSLCSTIPTDGCIATKDFNPERQYRIKVLGGNCFDKEINPLYCSEKDRDPIPPVYSNWFRLSK